MREDVRNFILLDGDTGVLRWHRSPGYKIKVGDAVGSLSHGYIAFRLRGKMYLAHRAVWYLTHGEWPPNGMQIDHINGVRSDNRIENLRLASNQENSRNSVPKKKNGGLKGAYYHKRLRRMPWFSSIKINGRSLLLGRFATEAEAAAAYQRAAAEHFGEFAWSPR